MIRVEGPGGYCLGSLDLAIRVPSAGSTGRTVGSARTLRCTGKYAHGASHRSPIPMGLVLPTIPGKRRETPLPEGYVVRWMFDQGYITSPEPDGRGRATTFIRNVSITSMEEYWAQSDIRDAEVGAGRGWWRKCGECLTWVNGFNCPTCLGPPSLKRLRMQVYRASRSCEFGAQPNDLTLEDWLDILREANGRCSYCGVSCWPTLDHDIRGSRDGKNTRGNIVAACQSCNAGKGDWTGEEWRAQLRKHQYLPPHPGDEKLLELAQARSIKLWEQRAVTTEEIGQS